MPRINDDVPLAAWRTFIMGWEYMEILMFFLLGGWGWMRSFIYIVQCTWAKIIHTPNIKVLICMHIYLINWNDLVYTVIHIHSIYTVKVHCERRVWVKFTHQHRAPTTAIEIYALYGYTEKFSRISLDIYKILTNSQMKKNHWTEICQLPNGDLNAIKRDSARFSLSYIIRK